MEKHRSFLLVFVTNLVLLASDILIPVANYGGQFSNNSLVYFSLKLWVNMFLGFVYRCFGFMNHALLFETALKFSLLTFYNVMFVVLSFPP